MGEGCVGGYHPCTLATLRQTSGGLALTSVLGLPALPQPEPAPLYHPGEVKSPLFQVTQVARGNQGWSGGGIIPASTPLIADVY